MGGAWIVAVAVDAEDEDGEVILLQPDLPAMIGGRMF